MFQFGAAPAARVYGSALVRVGAEVGAGSELIRAGGGGRELQLPLSGVSEIAQAFRGGRCRQIDDVDRRIAQRGSVGDTVDLKRPGDAETDARKQVASCLGVIRNVSVPWFTTL